jgi:hypothetical protein
MLLWQESVLTSLGFRFRESKRNRQRSFREPTEAEAQFPRSPLLGTSVNNARGRSYPMGRGVSGGGLEPRGPGLWGRGLLPQCVYVGKPFNLVLL